MAREYLSLDLSPPAGSICYSHSTLAQVVKQGQGSQPVSVGVQLAPPPPPKLHHTLHHPGEGLLPQKKGQVGRDDAELCQPVDIDWALTMMPGTVGLAENWKLWSTPSSCAPLAGEAGRQA